MPGQGMQNIPLRIPKEWDAAWYAKHIREVLALADTRNAIEGSGIQISGQPGEMATISASDDLQNLLLQTFVLATPSGFLNFERVLNGTGGIEIIDNGADSTIDVNIEDYGITLGKLTPLSSPGILGNPVAGAGEIQNIQPEATLAVLHYDGSDILFDLIDHTYISDFTEAVQDTVGLMLVDSSSIDFTYNDVAGTFTASTINANPTASIGLTAVNGTAATPMRSDGAPALSQAISPTWTGNHTFTPGSGHTVVHAGNFRLDLDNQEIEIGASQDLNLYHDGTDSWMFNATGQMYIRSQGNVILRNGTNDSMLVGSGFAIIKTPTARGGGLVYFTFNDPTGQKGFFGYGGTDDKMYIYNQMLDDLIFGSHNVEVARFDASSTAGDTRMLLYDVTAAAVVRVSRGAVDSGGAGFRVLRVPN